MKQRMSRINWVKTKSLSLLFLCSLIIFLLCPAAAVHAADGKGSDPQYIFYKGNTLYEEGKYEAAISEYSRLIEQGLESGHLYYNMGNSYFKSGEPGRAILYYEKAKRLIPGDSDLRSNYTYAMSNIRQVSSAASAPWYGKIFSLFNGFSVNGLSIALSIVYTLILFSVLAAFFFPAVKKHFHVAAGLLLVIFLVGAATLYHRVALLDSEAVILAEQAEARFEPMEKATTYFTLYEGMKVTVLQSRKGWMKVRRGDGKSGWIRTEDSEMI